MYAEWILGSLLNILFILSLFFIVYSVTAIPILFPFCPLNRTHPCVPQSIPSPLPMSMCSSYMFFDQSRPLSFTIAPSLLSSYNSQSVQCFHVSGSIFPVSLFCSLDSSYKGGHVVFVFCRLAYFTQHNSLQPKCP